MNPTSSATVEQEKITVSEPLFTKAFSKIQVLEAMADVVMVKPDGLAQGTIGLLQSSLYYGLSEVLDLLCECQDGGGK